MGHVGDAHGQLDVGQVDRSASQDVGQVDFDELGQSLRQAGDFQFGRHVADDGARQLHGRRDFSVHEVQRHLGTQGLVGVDALEVHVQDLRLVGVPLNRTQQNLLFLGAFELHLQDRRVEFFLAQGVVDLVVVEFDVQGGSRTTIDNGGNAARAAQAAARTRTLDATRSGDEFHGKLQKQNKVKRLHQLTARRATCAPC
ncbi:hypothetical protein D3C81_1712360 [compost metagenome]